LKNIKKKIINFLKNAKWYHTIEVPGFGKTNGVYDHKYVIKYYKFGNLKNKTCIDVGCSNGFFSFFFEKSGAKKVIAVDKVDDDGTVEIDPSQNSKSISLYKKKYQIFMKEKKIFSEIFSFFKLNSLHRLAILKKIFKSKIVFKKKNIFELKNQTQKFDLVFCGDLIEHLKDPISAVEILQKLTKKKCIISLSSSLFFMDRFKFFLKSIIQLKSISEILSSFNSIRYLGHVSGGAFFHFSPLEFKKICLASGFKRVIIVSNFKLLNNKTKEMNSHAIFHCFN
jgi:2-polyprenyl-3-methyl-5-hydroxy-6-metoxy-1,4-benzoquinol methylase